MSKSNPSVLLFHDPVGYQVVITCDDNWCKAEIVGAKKVVSQIIFETLIVDCDENGLPMRERVVSSQKIMLKSGGVDHEGHETKRAFVALPRGVTVSSIEQFYFRIISDLQDGVWTSPNTDLL